jgi:ketosteroid isomerase-like protein
MRRALVIVGATVAASVFLLVSPKGAGTNAAAEAAIRKLIAAESDGHAAPSMADRIVWTGAYQRPFVGQERGVPATSAQVPLADRASEKTVRTPMRIVVADSGDLAYEYETGSGTITLKDGSIRKIENAAIRVWQKDQGEWKVAVYFAAPYRQ